VARDLMHMGLSGDWEQGLDNLGASLKGGFLRSGGNAAAEVFQEEAKLLAPTFAGPAYKVAAGKVKPGQLREAIYRVYSRKQSDDDHVVYSVSWNHAKAPHGYWMENGNSRHAAHPFITPAYEAAKYRAIEQGLARMTVRYQQLNLPSTWT
jgi:hypothetical protein